MASLGLLFLASSAPADEPSPIEALDLLLCLEGRAAASGASLACGEWEGQEDELRAIVLAAATSNGMGGQLVPQAELDDELAALSRGVCAIVDPDDITRSGDVFVIRSDVIDLGGIPGAGSTITAARIQGTGFRVGESWIATAAHTGNCDALGDHYAVFGYEVTGPGKVTAPAGAVYPFNCIAAYPGYGNLDWAILNTQDTMDPSIPTFDLATDVGVGDPTYSLGYPLGLPLHGVGKGEVLTIGDQLATTGAALQFMTDLYTLDRMSGAPVLREGVVVGMHVATSHCASLDPPICGLSCADCAGDSCPHVDGVCCSSLESGVHGLPQFVMIRNDAQEVLHARVASRELVIPPGQSREVLLPRHSRLRIFSRLEPDGPLRLREVPLRRPGDAPTLGPRRVSVRVFRPDGVGVRDLFDFQVRFPNR